MLCSSRISFKESGALNRVKLAPEMTSFLSRSKKSHEMIAVQHLVTGHLRFRIMFQESSINHDQSKYLGRDLSWLLGTAVTTDLHWLPTKLKLTSPIGVLLVAKPPSRNNFSETKHRNSPRGPYSRCFFRSADITAIAVWQSYPIHFRTQHRCPSNLLFSQGFLNRSSTLKPYRTKNLGSISLNVGHIPQRALNHPDWHPSDSLQPTDSKFEAWA